MLETAVSRGHQVSIFTRGKTNIGLFPEVNHLIGDRDGHLNALRGKTWDAVVDTCGYFPRQARDSAKLLRDQVGQYVFVSTMSIYDYTQNAPITDERASLISLDDPKTETIDSEWTYGGLKVLCEKAIDEIFPDNALHLRPTFVAGPYDSTDRFTYWVKRVAKGGDIAVPAYPEQLIQWVDARDLADFAINGIEQRINGAFNLAAPSYTWETWLNGCRDTLNSKANFVWLEDEAFLRESVGLKDITSTMFPFCMDKKYAKARCNLTAEKARKLFLRSRHLSETVKDTIIWDKHRTGKGSAAFITSEQEIELLKQWRSWSNQPTTMS